MRRWWAAPLLLAACTSDPAGGGVTRTDSGPVVGLDTGPRVRDTGGPPAPVDPGPLPLCINEFMPANDSALVVTGGATPDWIELHNPGDETVNVSSWTLTDDPAVPDAARVPIGTEIPAGGFLVFLADDSDEAGHLPFRLSAEGGSIGLYDPDGNGQVIHYGRVEDDFSVARTPDCCTGEGCLGFDFRGTPGAPNTPIVWTEQTVVPAGSVWRFRDGGVPPGSAWFLRDFEDGDWGSGPAPLGFGDTHIVTPIDGGPDGARYPTTWFRLAFSLDDPTVIGEAWLDLMLDDGAVVRVNGTEALRTNLPEGEIAPDTLALGSIGPPNETTFFRFPIDPTLLVEGENLLAVEVHQAALTSSDLTWDASLVVTTPAPAE